MRSIKADTPRPAASIPVSEHPGRISVRLHYAFDAEPQDGDALGNPVIEILTAVEAAGSIRHAAQRLGKSYRHVWGALRHWESVFGEPLLSWSQGQRARLSVFAGHLLRAERRARERARPHIEKLRSDLEAVLDETRHERSHALALHASHDLALPVLRQYMAEHENLQFELEFQGSVNALRSLRDRQCLMAGFHVPLLSAAAPVFSAALRPLLDPAHHRLLICSQRTQGLMMRKELALRVGSLADVVSQQLRFVNRQPGSGTRMLTEHLLQAGCISASDIPRFASHMESSHLAAALCIAGGVADVGVGVEAAALHYGLHFSPLVKEVYYLACEADHVDHPVMKRVQRVLAGSAWRAILTAMPGYEPGDAMGAVREVQTTFSWWNDG